MSTGSITTAFSDLGRRAILELWHRHGSKPRLGLAISGGVDSMALATLCSSIIGTTSSSSIDFTGFIVDHGLRKGSSDEAEKVAAELDRLKIRPRILKLDRSWSIDETGAADHLENTARRLRYRAMGRACYDQGIESLLVAHHSDDQAETVLQRLLGRYLGNGLSGIKAEAGIPHCEGLHGVYESGGLPSDVRENALHKYRVLRESGGVKILRPLLPATKSQLIELCELFGTKWFEDHTNADVGVATRNALRYLQKDDLLPMALRRTGMFSLANNVSRKMQEIERLARLELDRSDVLLDVRTGKAAFTIRKGVFSDFGLPPDVEYNAKAVMLRMLVNLVSPVTKTELSKMYSGVEVVFPSAEKGDPDLLFQDVPMKLDVAGVQIRRVSGTTGFLAYTLRRALPTTVELSKGHVVLPEAIESETSLDLPKWKTEWQLWDNRYWIRLGSMQRDVVIGRTFMVRTYTKEDKGNIVKASSPDQKLALSSALTEVPGKGRFSLPAIVEQHEDGRETVIALPTLGWHMLDCESWPVSHIKASDQRLLWDVRYKQVDYPLNRDLHKVIDHLPDVRGRETSWSVPGQRRSVNSYWRQRVQDMIAKRQKLESRGVLNNVSLREFIGLDQSRRMSTGRKYVMEKKRRQRVDSRAQLRWHPGHDTQFG